MVQSLSKPQTPIASSPESSPLNPLWNPLNLPPSRLFGTDGIRGKAGDLLNAPFALQLGFWAGHVLRPQGIGSGIVILGQDSRNSSDMLAMSLSAGLTAAGLEVWNVGLCPTPCVAYLTAETEAIAGIMISASHNPPEDNGIKFFGSDGTKLSQTVQGHIEAAIRGQSHPYTNPPHWGQHYHRPELLKQYATALHEPLVNTLNLQGMRVVLDLAWGAAVPVAPGVFEDLGAEVICLHNRADGDRINVNCGSTHLASLQAAVQEHNADLGFAFDGDADRVIAVDSEGRPVDGDYILYLWGCTLHHAQKLPNQTIISTVMANLGFENAWAKLGGKLVRTAVGDQHVHAEMVKSGAMLGGEQSGHILCHHYSLTGDGLQTALHLSAIVRQSGTSLTDLVNQSFQPYPQLLKNVRVEDRHTRLNWHTCQPLQEAIAHATEALGNQGRILVRASGTEPVVRVMVEAIQDNLALHWTDNLVQAVQRHLV